MNPLRRTFLLAAAAALAGGAPAAPFNPDRVPAEARWVVHFDADLLKTTTVGQHVMPIFNSCI